MRERRNTSSVSWRFPPPLDDDDESLEVVVGALAGETGAERRKKSRLCSCKLQRRKEKRDKEALYAFLFFANNRGQEKIFLSLLSLSPTLHSQQTFLRYKKKK